MTHSIYYIFKESGDGGKDIENRFNKVHKTRILLVKYHVKVISLSV